MTITDPRPLDDVASDLYPVLRKLQRDLRAAALELPVDDPRGGQLVHAASRASVVAERLNWFCGPLGPMAAEDPDLQALHAELIASVDDVGTFDVIKTVGLLGSLIGTVRQL